MNQLSPEHTVLTPLQLADRWGISPRTLANMRSLRKGPGYVRISTQRVVYPLSEILAWEEGGRKSHGKTVGPTISPSHETRWS